VQIGFAAYGITEISPRAASLARWGNGRRVVMVPRGGKYLPARIPGAARRGRLTARQALEPPAIAVALGRIRAKTVPG
jgi:hypothetical protein